MFINFLNFREILTYNFFGNSAQEYLIGLGVFVLAMVFLYLFKKQGIKKLRKIGNNIKIETYDSLIKIIESIKPWVYIVLSLWIASQFINLAVKIEKYFSYFVLIIIIFYIIKIIIEFVNFFTLKIIEKNEEEGKKIDPSGVNILNKILKGVIWVIAILLILQNLGFNVTTLIAGLGIGGIAIAFALQGVLTDIFACFSIYLDKPFQTGDFIIIDDDLGTIIKIGIKSTRIQTLQGEELVISNRELIEKRVHNYKKMEKRRIEFTFGVVYETSSEALKKIPIIIKNILDRVESADLDRVHFKKFGDWSLDFDVVYYVAVPDYNKYMDVQQEINLAIKEEFEKENIEFAYPTQSILLNKS
ncbi:MAG: mechanosensitive ion channel family protein [Patescibacteria group bacterium]|nr:mechanosensitive ion channel family protein [Patescibacteria group bacterium]